MNCKVHLNSFQEKIKLTTFLLQMWQYSCASRVLSPFNVAVALSIAGMNVLNDHVSLPLCVNVR